MGEQTRWEECPFAIGSRAWTLHAGILRFNQCVVIEKPAAQASFSAAQVRIPRFHQLHRLHFLRVGQSGRFQITGEQT